MVDAVLQTASAYLIDLFAKSSLNLRGLKKE